MVFDGAELNLEDSVYDVAYGSGRIIEINDKTFTFRVAFGARAFLYDLQGFGTFPRKTLFWRDPIQGFVPPKNTMKWDTFCNIRNAVAKELGH